MPRDKTNPTVTCACGREADPYYEEVDIGIGVQRHLAGWECYEHGGICGVCGSCGIADGDPSTFLDFVNDVLGDIPLGERESVRRPPPAHTPRG